MFTVYMNKKGVMIKQVYGTYFAVFTNHGNRHVCDRNTIEEAILVADSL